MKILVRVVLCCILLSLRNALALLVGLEFAASGRGQFSQVVPTPVGSLMSPLCLPGFLGHCHKQSRDVGTAAVAQAHC